MTTDERDRVEEALRQVDAIFRSGMQGDLCESCRVIGGIDHAADCPITILRAALSRPTEPDGYLVGWRQTDERWADWHDVAPCRDRTQAELRAHEYRQMGHEVRIRPFRYIPAAPSPQATPEEDDLCPHHRSMESCEECRTLDRAGDLTPEEPEASEREPDQVRNAGIIRHAIDALEQAETMVPEWQAREAEKVVRNLTRLASPPTSEEGERLGEALTLLAEARPPERPGASLVWLARRDKLLHHYGGGSDVTP